MEMLAGFSFIFGIVIGSFLNVCIYRLPNNISLVKPGSFCPQCGSHIPFYYNIPLLAYLFLGGKCHFCSAPISIRYFLVELLSGLLTLFAYLKFGFTGEFLFYSVFFYFLIVISLIDLATQLIYNKMLIFMLASGVVINLLFSVQPWLDAVIGLFAGSVALFLFALLGRVLFKKESMGMGDVKFAVVLGFFLGWKMVLLALLLGFIIAMVVSVVLMSFKFNKTDGYVPMGPFFSLGAIAFVFWGALILHWYWGLFIPVNN